jgi:outer membrane protein, multidrug efflux system
MKYLRCDSVARWHFLVRLILVFGSAQTTLTGCNSGPDYERPAISSAKNWHESSNNDIWKIANPNDAQFKGKWWEIFGDAQLNALQTQAQSGNFSVQSAIARLDQARALNQAARSALFPVLDIEVQHTRVRSSANRANNDSGNSAASTLRDNNTVAAVVNYEIDLFGRARRADEASKAGAEQVAADLENIKLLLSADVTANYFQLRALTAELDVLDQSIQAQSGILEIMRDRYTEGAANGIDLAQQQLTVANNREQRELLLQQYDHQRHALTALLGIRIDQLKIDIAPLQGEIPSIPLTLPSDLLQRRPDIAGAERAVAAANADIGIATSAWFPTLNISARDGFESSPFNKLFDAPSAAWLIGAGVTQKIFSGGATQARVKFSEAKHREAIANYRATVLFAWREVEDNLSSARALSAAHMHAKQARTAALKIADITDDRYQAGLSSAIERYIARQVALNAQREEVQVSAQRWANTVALIKALGGGWNGETVVAVDTPISD